MRTAAAAALLALLAAPAARAFRPLTPPAPEFPADAAWVNSAPLPLSLLRGRRVSLVAFLNLSNLRSQRAARVLGRLWDRYALHGLMIIGVHSPDYEFDRDALQVRRTVRESGIKFPVVVDTRRELWNAYQNVGWPAFYLLSPKGLILTDRLGEGHYEGLERDILMALHEFNGYRVPGDRPTETDPPRERCGTATPSFYLGARRGVKVGKYSTKAEPIDERRDGEADVYGPWENGSEALRFTGDGAGLKSQFYLIWRGAQMGAIMSPGAGSSVRVYVKLDNLWLHSGNGGPDVRWDDQDRSYVQVDEGRLYMLAHDTHRDRFHELSIFPGGPGAALYGFEFADQCEAALK